MPGTVYRILSIIRGTTVDGPGFRTSIYFAGCCHRCKGCHNPESWNFEGGTEMRLEEIMEAVREEDFDVTFSGGDPLLHKSDIRVLEEAIAAEGKRIWIYTGFTWEEIMRSERLRRLVALAETVIEGRYMESLRDPDLIFRGSSNQRMMHPGEYMNREGHLLSPEHGCEYQEDRIDLKTADKHDERQDPF